MRLDLSEAFVRDALEKGDVCPAILRNGAIVSYSWCAFTPTHDEDGVFVHFGGTYRYAYKSFTLPEYRGQHLIRVLAPIRDRYQELQADRAGLEDVLRAGAERARSIASGTLADVRERMGVGPPD